MIKILIPLGFNIFLPISPSLYLLYIFFHLFHDLMLCLRKYQRDKNYFKLDNIHRLYKKFSVFCTHNSAVTYTCLFKKDKKTLRIHVPKKILHQIKK